MSNNPIYIAGPDGKPTEFASETEANAYRRAQREAEPPLLQAMRKHRGEVFRLLDEVEVPGARRGSLRQMLASRLRSLSIAMAEDIKAAEREIAAKEPKP